MTIPHSWAHIVPQGQPSVADISHHAAGGNKQQAAKELLGAYKNAPHIKGKLPTLEELPHTTFCVNPENKAEGAIVFLHPHHRGRTVDYCFLETNNHEAMAEIEAKYNAYNTCTTTSYPAGTAPLERLPLEIIHQITGNLWGKEGLWNDNPDVKKLLMVSRIIRVRLLEVQKVSEIEKRFAALPSLPAENVKDEVDAIATYGLSDKPVKLVGASLLAAFRHYVQAFVAIMRDGQRSRLIDTGTFIDTSIQFIEGMKSDHDEAKALSILNECPAPIFNSFMLGFSKDKEFERGGKLMNIVTKMKSADAKADSIAAVGNMLRLGGSSDRQKILYVSPLIELAESLEVGPEALDKIGLAFLNVRIHLASYCAIHYDASDPRYAWGGHNPAVDTEENQEADLETGRKLDAFLARHDFDLPAIGGLSANVPLWQTAARNQ